MNNSNAPGTATEAFDADYFWERLDVSIEFVEITGSDKLLRLMMDEYCAHTAQLNADMVRDAKRRAMWQRALAAFTKH